MDGGERRLDRLGLGSLRIYQDPGVFKFTVDPILAADFLRAYPRERILDLGTGGGVIPLWLAGYRGFQSVAGLEIQPAVAGLAIESVALNGLSDRVSIFVGDLRDPPQELRQNPFSWVISNPPYLPASSRLSGNSVLDVAKFELECTLRDVVKASRDLTSGNGRLVLIHLPERLPEIFATFRAFGFEPKLMRLVHPSPDKPPNRVLIEGQKGGKPHLRVLPPLFIHGADGGFSAEMTAIYSARRNAGG